MLSDFETAPKHDGDYADALARLQKRLARIQIAHIVHRRRTMILFEGWSASGKGGTIQRLTAAWDPRHFHVSPIGEPTPEEAMRHFLWRFWARLPGAGDINIFDRSWYGRVLGDRVAGRVDKAHWRRAYDEINEFEAQQKDSGTSVVKLFLHITHDEQERRLRARIDDPWKRWKVTPDDLRSRDSRDAHVAAIEEMLAKTDTRWAPWKLIDAGHKKHARLAALSYVADMLEKAVPAAPPAPDEALMRLARATFGMAQADA